MRRGVEAIESKLALDDITCPNLRGRDLLSRRSVQEVRALSRWPLPGLHEYLLGAVHVMIKVYLKVMQGV